MNVRRVITFHRSHYLPLYALAGVLILIVAVFPSKVAHVSPTPDAALGVTDTVDGGGPKDAPRAGAGPSGKATPGDPEVVGAIGSAKPSATPFRPAVTGTGTTRGGFRCAPDVRQIPWSTYAVPCTPKFSGNNGGATYRGVTKDTIKIAIRRLADDRVADRLVETAGFGNPEDWDRVRKIFASYFNKTFELYGRQVELVPFNGSGSTFDELNGKGNDAACIDANRLANEDKAFGVIYWNIAGTSGPFSECAARQKLFVPWAAPYYPEGTTTKEPSYFKRWHPYIWTPFPNGETIAHLGAEYIGKRLTGRKATWAGSAAYRSQQRVFGMIAPKADAYRVVGDLLERDGKEWGFNIESRFDYVGDPATLGEQMSSAVAQFKDAGVTTLILVCGPDATTILTNAASMNDWHPEWLNLGLGGSDNDATARTYNQDQVDGHMFGLGPMPGAQAYAVDGEARRAWDLAAPGEEPPIFMEINYYFMLDLFNKLQAAGPYLKPQNVANGLQTFRAGTRDDPLGVMSYTDDHAALGDAREIYWRSAATGTDGVKGGFIDAFGGRRFGIGEIPRAAPSIYP